MKDSNNEMKIIDEKIKSEETEELSECIKTPAKLTKKQNVIHAVKFACFSASAGVIQFVSFTLLNELAHFKYWPAYLIALTLSVIYNFTVNRKFTFKSANNVPIAMLKVFGYYLVFTPLSTLWGDALTNAGWNEYIVLIGTMIINLITEFTFCRFVVYRNSINTNKEGKKENLKYYQLNKELGEEEVELEDTDKSQL